MRVATRLVLGWLALALAVGLGACATFAAEPTRQGKIAAPPAWQPPAYVPPAVVETTPEWTVHNWYLGLVGGYALAPEHMEHMDGTWQGGVVGGYLWRPTQTFGLGIEADYVVRDLGNFRLDDGTATLRARAGVFFGRSFIYGTAGIREAVGDVMPDALRRGPVVGVGVEQDIAKHMTIRLEALHYRHAPEYLEWGDDGSTAVRLGVAFKL